MERFYCLKRNIQIMEGFLYITDVYIYMIQFTHVLYYLN